MRRDIKEDPLFINISKIVYYSNKNEPNIANINIKKLIEIEKERNRNLTRRKICIIVSYELYATLFIKYKNNKDFLDNVKDRPYVFESILNYYKDEEKKMNTRKNTKFVGDELNNYESYNRNPEEELLLKEYLFFIGDVIGEELKNKLLLGNSLTAAIKELFNVTDKNKIQFYINKFREDVKKFKKMYDKMSKNYIYIESTKKNIIEIRKIIEDKRRELKNEKRDLKEMYDEVGDSIININDMQNDFFNEITKEL